MYDGYFWSEPNLVKKIQIRFDTVQVNYQRAIYNSLDLLGDVGGLFDGLKLIAWLIVNIFTSENLENLLEAKLFFTSFSNPKN